MQHPHPSNLTCNLERTRPMYYDTQKERIATCQGNDNDLNSDLNSYGFEGTVTEFNKFNELDIDKMARFPEHFQPCLFEMCKHKCYNNPVGNTIKIFDEELCGCYYPEVVYEKLDERLSSSSGILPQRSSSDLYNVDPMTAGLFAGGAGRACRFNICANATIPLNSDYVSQPYDIYKYKDENWGNTYPTIPSQDCRKALQCPNVRSARCIQHADIMDEGTVYINTPTTINQRCNITFPTKKNAEEDLEGYVNKQNSFQVFYRDRDGNLAATNITIGVSLSLAAVLIVLAFSLTFFSNKKIRK
jgi:hypothetical protein